MERRHIVGGGLVAGLTALVAPESAAGGGAVDDDAARIAKSVDDFRLLVERGFRVSDGVEEMRRQQRVWLKSHQKYPDFIEVGVDVWEAVYDWHVKYQQPIAANVLADGRYVITFMFTTIVMRPDQPDNYVGYPYDGAAPRR